MRGGDLNAVSDNRHTRGMAWFLDWGSLRFALGAAFSAALYFDVTGEARYRDFALRQLDYALGVNGYDRAS